MADKKITDLVDGGAPQATDEFVIARAGDNFKVDYASLESAGLAGAVILAPASSARNVIQPTAGAVIAAIVKAHAAQSVDLMQWQDSAGAVFNRITSAGRAQLGAAPTDFDASFQFVPGNAQTLLGVVGNPFRYAAVIQSERTGALANGNDVEGAFIAAIANHSGTGAPDVVGADLEAFAYGTNAGDIRGSFYYAEFGGAGHANSIRSVEISPNLSWNGGTVDNNYGIYVAGQSTSNATVNYGIYLEDQLTGFGIYVAGGRSVFATLLTHRITVPADADIANSQGGWWWDQANSLPKWKGKTSGGVVVNFTPAAAGSGAPSTATYITQTADAGLSAEQALSALATGLVKNTTGTGVLSIGAQGTDYYAPGGTDVAVADGGTGASTAAAARTNLGIPDYARPKVSQQWYVPVPIYVAAVAAATQSRLSLSPIELPAGITLDRLGVNQQGAGVASCVFRMGIYSDNGNFYPGTLLLDAGTVDFSTASAVKTITISQAIATAGVYWIGGVAQGAAPPTTINIGNQTQEGMFGIPVAAASLFVKATSFYEAAVTGALPGTFTSTVNTLNVGVPNVAVRIS